MKDFLNAVSNFLKGIAALVVASVIGVASWLGYGEYSKNVQLGEKFKQSQAENEQLHKDVVEKERQIEKLDMALRLLKVDHRVADIIVLKQWKSEVENRQKTKFVFQDVNDDDQPLDKAREFTIDGDLLYIDAWVVKYDDDLVQKGDPLRSTSVCLFRRMFGEFQEPSEGASLDHVNSRPAAYGRGPLSDYEKELWANFWEYSNDPAKAKKAGIRAAHGEAPSIKLREGLLYKLQLRASGGLTIVPENLPPDRMKSL